ncbi:MAG: SUF system NifU family Fe-S cluster assembly protein [Gemmatimonadetes bacterium]|nr:SUF system NifU family Fe-S cluster assembly protein [Gemmatimonadota bacterium]|tara:strand:- start:275 stop:727 length:453 start_codon:yes stop_codon:yes gene_type:complete
MSELTDLYQEIILDHNKNPRNFGPLSSANRSREGYNPLCGDHLHVHMQISDGTVKAINFEGSGCAISKASASLMTSALKGKSIEEAEKLFADFHAMVTADVSQPVDENSLGKMAIFAGVREFPMRVKCCTLAWHAMKSGIDGDDNVVSTE